MAEAVSVEHRVLVADELGMLRCIDKPGTSGWNALPVSPCEGVMDKHQGVDCIEVLRGSGEDDGKSVFAVGRVSGEVTVYDGTSKAALQSIQPPVSKAANAGIAGMAWLQSQGRQASLLVCHRSGTVCIYKCDANQWQLETSYNVESSILCCAVSQDETLLALGCDGCELRTVDVATGVVVSKLKGGRPNPQTRLVDKPWVSCLTWLPGGNGRKVLTGTGYHKLRLYDVEAQKRPIFEVSWLDARITCVAAAHDGQSVWVSNAKGFIQVLDLHTQRMMGSLKGQIAGSIRCMALHPTEQLLCSVGLDRWVRIHDTASRKLLLSTYLKSQLTACAWAPGSPPPPSAPALTHAGDSAVADGAVTGSDAVEKAASNAGKPKSKKRKTAAAADSVLSEELVSVGTADGPEAAKVKHDVKKKAVSASTDEEAPTKKKAKKRKAVAASS